MKHTFHIAVILNRHQTIKSIPFYFHFSPHAAYYALLLKSMPLLTYQFAHQIMDGLYDWEKVLYASKCFM